MNNPYEPGSDHKLGNSQLALLKRAITKAFDENRDYLLYQLLISNTSSSSKDVKSEHAVEELWVAIDSISKLRGLVGGRFDSLKAKWQAAGLPLKEKKGEALPQFTVNPIGWRELEAWLNKLGYSARLKPNNPEVIFEIKKAL